MFYRTDWHRLWIYPWFGERFDHRWTIGDVGRRNGTEWLWGRFAQRKTALQGWEKDKKVCAARIERRRHHPRLGHGSALRCRHEEADGRGRRSILQVRSNSMPTRYLTCFLPYKMNWTRILFNVNAFNFRNFSTLVIDLFSLSSLLSPT